MKTNRSVPEAAVIPQDPAEHVWTFSESIADVDPADWGGTLKD